MAFSKALKAVSQNTRGRCILTTGVLLILCILFLFGCVSVTESLTLQAYTLLIVFDLLCIVTVLVYVWSNEAETTSPNDHFSYGRARYDVLCIFASTILVQLGSLFVAKECIEQLLQDDEDEDVDESPTLLPVAALIAFTVHCFVSYAIPQSSLCVVINGSSSSWLQEHCADLSHTLCRLVPGLSRFLLPRVNPLAFMNILGCTLCFLNFVLLESSQCYACDSFLGLCLIFMIIGTMKPLAVYSGRILLQTSPTHILPQLDKSMREASTLDGVLEIADDHFWQLSLSRMAGSVVVRVRRDADEQLVLAQVTGKLYPLVADLTVQVNKDTSWRPVILN